jgi:HemY protein
MFNFIRGFIFFTKLTILIALGVVLAQFPGHATLTWLGYRIEMSIGILLAALLFAVAILLFIFGAWRFLWRLPILMARRRQDRRRHKGQIALYEGLGAIAAGELSEARRLGKRAASFSEEQPLAVLLSAQAAYLSGKHEEASKYFQQLSKNKDTAFLGLRGLILTARHTNNWEQMRHLLHEALGKRPNSPWVLQQLLELDLRLNAYDKASMIVEQMQSRQLITKTMSRRRQALIHWLKAEAAIKAGDKALFLQTAMSAHLEAPELVAIAVRLVDYYQKIGKTSKALKILNGSFAQNPHPDYAARLQELNADMNSLDYYRTLEKLVEGAPNHPESLYCLAQGAKGAKLWGQARHHLTLLKGQMYSQRVCRLMAELEEEENPQDAHKAHEWWERAATAPADPTWVCNSCHAATPAWHPICPACEGFDQISWQIPATQLAVSSAVSKAAPPLLG